MNFGLAVVAIIAFAACTAASCLLVVFGAGVIELIKEQWEIINDK